MVNPHVVLVCGCVILLLGFGLRAGFGLFLQPMSLEFGWGREVFSFAMALQNLVWGALAAFAGGIADRRGAGRVLAACGAFYVLGLMVMAFAKTPLTLYLFACGMGLLWLSTVPLTNGLVGQIFGLRYAAMLASIVFFGHQLGSFIGVWLAGYLYDTTGSYSGALLLSMALGAAAALVHLPVNEKPLAERRAVPAGA